MDREALTKYILRTNLFCHNKIQNAKKFIKIRKFQELTNCGKFVTEVLIFATTNTFFFNCRWDVSLAVAPNYSPASFFRNTG